MRDDFRRLFADSMDTVHLSREAKERLIASLAKQAAYDQGAYDQGKAETGMENQGKRKAFRRAMVLALAAVLLIGTLSAGAAYWVSRSRGLEAELHMTEEQRRQAEESGLSASPDSVQAAGEITSATDNGITITAEQTIVDNYFAMLSFRVDGYDVPEGQYPDIGDIRIILNGISASWSGGFYDGIVSENGRAAYYEDGSPLEYTPEGGIRYRYAAADGSLRYHVMLMGDPNPMEREAEGVIAGSLIGKEIEIRFTGIGTGDKAEYFPDRDGTWNLRWTLTGSDAVRTVFPNRAIGDSGAVLAEAEISPISLRAVYRISPEMESARIAAVDDDDVIPRLLGVRMKDGTLYPYLYMGPGSSGGDPEQGTYETRFAVDRILDTKNVDALLFLKSYPEEEETLAEENLYVVPLGETGA